ncbi:hypothetical protein SUGI_0666950 [Cryptomeria japonica]|nr:hypothetical protein SUGI_0666950 [Cryptomeria japonica]
MAISALQKWLEVNGGVGRNTGKPNGWRGPEEDETVAESWGDHVVIKFIPRGFFVVLFENHLDRDHILNQENWYADKHPVYLQPWIPKFNSIPLVVYSSPIWVNLYNLPIKYSGESYLEKIGRMLGTVLEINFNNEEDLCKLVKIKVVAVKKIPEYIYLQTANRVWRQRLEIKKERKHCSKRGNKSHAIENCRLFVRKARNPLRNPEQQWMRKLEKMVTDSVVERDEVKTPRSQGNEE